MQRLEEGPTFTVTAPPLYTPLKTRPWCVLVMNCPSSTPSSVLDTCKSFHTAQGRNSAQEEGFRLIHKQGPPKGWCSSKAHSPTLEPGPSLLCTRKHSDRVFNKTEGKVQDRLTKPSPFSGHAVLCCAVLCCDKTSYPSSHVCNARAMLCAVTRRHITHVMHTELCCDASAH